MSQNNCAVTRGERKWKTGSRAARARWKLANFAAKFSARKSTDGGHFPQHHFPPCLVKNRGCDWPHPSPVVGMVTFPIRPQDQVQRICCSLHVADSGSQQRLTTPPPPPTPLLWPRSQGCTGNLPRTFVLEAFWQFRFGSEVASGNLIEFEYFHCTFSTLLSSISQFLLSDNEMCWKDQDI